MHAFCILPLRGLGTNTSSLLFFFSVAREYFLPVFLNLWFTSTKEKSVIPFVAGQIYQIGPSGALLHDLGARGALLQLAVSQITLRASRSI